MTLSAYRIIKEKFAHTAFTGEGARLYGVRWSSKGIPIIYSAEHISLAVLEILVGLLDIDILSRYILYNLSFEEELVETLKDDELPNNWKIFPHPLTTKRIGDRWFTEARSVILSVPSSIIPAERNILINPKHPDYHKITISDPFPIDIDPRLFRHTN